MSRELPQAARPFLTAEWRDLILINFAIEPGLLTRFVPAGTELDSPGGVTSVSLVAFRFVNTRVRGCTIPFHVSFEEVNLRFYVRRLAGRELRRAVVFIKEIVPRRVIAAIARAVYNENYVACPMSHVIKQSQGVREIEYRWQTGAGESAISAAALGEPIALRENTPAEFFLEHYWGYSRSRRGKTIEYEVTHPRWRVWEDAAVSLDIDGHATYGGAWAEVLSRPWHSALVAEGSAVRVFPGKVLNET